MRKILFILSFFFAFGAKAQTFYDIKTLKKENGRISAYNSTNVLIFQVECDDATWLQFQDGSIKVWDDKKEYTIYSTKLTGPAWGAVRDSLNKWMDECSSTASPFPTNLDTTQTDTSLIAAQQLNVVNQQLSDIKAKLYSISFDTSTIDTSLIAPKDYTALLELLASKSYDTSTVDTSLIVPTYLVNIDSKLKAINDKLYSTAFDTSTIDTSLVPQIDYTSLLEILASKSYDTSTIDTSQIVPTYLLNIDTKLQAISDKLYSTSFDTSTIDTSLVPQIDYTNLLQILASKSYDTSTFDTSLVLPQINANILEQLYILNSKGLDSSQVDTSLINYIASFDTTINRLDSILASIKRQSSIDTTHTAILNDIKELISKLDTSSIDTSLVPMVDYSELFYALINKGYDTSQVDTALDKHILLDSTSVRILNDSIKVYFNQILDTSNSGVLLAIHNLLKDSLDKNVFINNDSLRVWFEQKNDTIDFEYKTYCYRGKSDSGVYSLNVVFSALTPYTPIFMNFLNVDSLSEIFRIDNRLGATFGTFPNIPQDYVPCEKWNEYLTANSTKDTLKGLVYTAIAKVRTNRDTLFNCKSLSFGRKSGASGTLVLTYENGESESYDVANDDLPTWVNGEFISYIDYNATGAVGLIVNTLGCSQTSTEICAKVKPIFDCELVVPITCNGWQSASGVWQTISGCWNTGQ